jgi:hypothetical protein
MGVVDDVVAGVEDGALEVVEVVGAGVVLDEVVAPVASIVHMPKFGAQQTIAVGGR